LYTVEYLFNWYLSLCQYTQFYAILIYFKEIEFTLYLRVNWKDPRLDFTRNETTYDVISFKFGDDIVKNLWIPDLFFLNERQSRLHGLIARDQLVYIYKNGSVFYSGRFDVYLYICRRPSVKLVFGRFNPYFRRFRNWKSILNCLNYFTSFKYILKKNNAYKILFLQML
jgi:hypothetical protein